jgi:hypothetical protein
VIVLCKGCQEYYPDDECENIAGWHYCEGCVGILYPKGEYQNTESTPCYICHRVLPDYLMIDVEVYVNDAGTIHRKFCPVCKNGNGLADVNYPVSQCYACGRFFDKETGELKHLKIGQQTWVDRWLCSTCTVLLGEG